MLKSIFIKNFALAHNLQLEFQKGLNILTGETGTGKSILIGAISAVLGGRVYSEIVRSGADKALVEAIFDIHSLSELKNLLKEKGLESNEEIFLRREIPVKGTSRAFINDIPITISTLAEIGDLLVDIHGQNEHQSLLRKETHRYFIDGLGKLSAELQGVNQAYLEVQRAKEALQNLEIQSKMLAEKYELYQFQIQEIKKSQLQNDEDVQLENERKILINAEKIYALTTRFHEITDGNKENNLSELMGSAQHLLLELAEFSQELKTISQEFASAKIVIEEATRSVEEFQNQLEYNPKRLEEIEQRLATISVLKKKYGKTIQDIFHYLATIEKELFLQENIDFELDKYRKELTEKIKIYGEQALSLSRSRQAAAKKLEQQVIRLLKEIGMPKMRFRVDFLWLESEHGIFQHQGKTYQGDEWGVDQIEFFISPNPGEDFKPLAKIASGGEISRIMLALKNILAESDRIPLLIFDEIDAGVSGQIALAVGKSIQSLAQTHQIICITHLPQIASFGKAHYQVEKYVDDGRTFTRVNVLAGENRVKEIAGLMGGKKLSEEILQSARQLIKEATEQGAGD